MRTTYKITNGSGIVYTVQRGLVDSEGVFFYVMETGEVKHYRFSTESELITLLADELIELRKTADKMHEVIDNLARANESNKAHLAELREKYAALKEAQSGGESDD